MPSLGAGARRYAQAVFELARESGKYEEWLDDLQTMNAVFEDRLVGRYFLDPKQRNLEKVDAVRQMFAGRVQPEALNLLMILVERGRTPLLPRILERYQSLSREAHGIVIAEVTTAIPVEEDERQRIAEELGRMTGKQVQLQTKVDPEIIGGMIARIGDKLIDGSVRTSLLQLRQSLR